MSIARTLLLCLALLASGCAPTAAELAAGQVFDDGVTTARVKRALLHQEGVRLAEVEVATENGVVRLSGLVASDQAQRAAEQATRAVAGVKAVKNDLRVRR